MDSNYRSFFSILIDDALTLLDSVRGKANEEQQKSLDINHDNFLEVKQKLDTNQTITNEDFVQLSYCMKLYSMFLEERVERERKLIDSLNVEVLPNLAAIVKKGTSQKIVDEMSKAIFKVQ